VLLLVTRIRRVHICCGQLGFERNAARFAEILGEMGIIEHLRGFSTNGARQLPYIQ
jgi:hypothetical protein